MKFVREYLNEVQNFERNIDPKTAMDIGDKNHQLIKYSEVANKLKTLSIKKRLYCVYIFEPNIVRTFYYTDAKDVLECYEGEALEGLKFPDNHQNICIYLIDLTKFKKGNFVDEREMEGYEGVKVIFSISIQDYKIYYPDGSKINLNP